MEIDVGISLHGPLTGVGLNGDPIVAIEEKARELETIVEEARQPIRELEASVEVQEFMPIAATLTEY